jgi:hypothetical protein
MTIQKLIPIFNFQLINGSKNGVLTKFSINPLGGEVEKGELKFHSFVQEPGKILAPSCVVPVRLDLTNSTVLKSVFNAEVLDVPMELVFPHPVTQVTYKPKNLRYLMLTLQVANQLEDIDAIKVEDQFFIVDGMSRYLAAQQLGFESIPVWFKKLIPPIKPLLHDKFRIVFYRTN